MTLEVEDQSNRPKVVLITGCSSGLGHALALKLADRGYIVYAGVRKTTDMNQLSQDASALSNAKNLIPILLDVTRDECVREVMDRIEQDQQGRIDVLVNNAGCCIFGGIESLTMEQCHMQFETNFFGCVRLMQHVLPLMRRLGRGLVLNVGSLGGIWGQPITDVYCASKFALEGLVESMSSYYRQLGIAIVVLEPGAIATALMGKGDLRSLESAPEDLKPIYERVHQFYARRINDSHAGTQTADEVAEFCIREIIEHTNKSSGENGEETEKRSLDTMPVRFQCNPAIQPIFDMKLKDVDGLKLLKFTQSRMLSGDN